MAPWGSINGAMNDEFKTSMALARCWGSNATRDNNNSKPPSIDCTKETKIESCQNTYDKLKEGEEKQPQIRTSNDRLAREMNLFVPNETEYFLLSRAKRLASLGLFFLLVDFEPPRPFLFAWPSRHSCTTAQTLDSWSVADSCGRPNNTSNL